MHGVACLYIYMSLVDRLAGIRSLLTKSAENEVALILAS